MNINFRYSYFYFGIYHTNEERSGKMSFQIRQAITSNVTGDSSAEFENTINDAIARGEEHLLPGLGVFLGLVERCIRK